MEIGIVRGEVPRPKQKIIFHDCYACWRVTGKVFKVFSAAIAQILATIMFAQTHAEACRAQMAAVLVRAEVAVVQVFGEVNVAEGVSPSDGELIVMPGEPSQRFAPFAFAMIAVRVMREGEAAGN